MQVGFAFTLVFIHLQISNTVNNGRFFFAIDIFATIYHTLASTLIQPGFCKLYHRDIKRENYAMEAAHFYKTLTQMFIRSDAIFTVYFGSNGRITRTLCRGRTRITPL